MLKILILFLFIGNNSAEGKRAQIEFHPNQLKRELKRAKLEESQLSLIDSIGGTGKIFRIKNKEKSNGYVYIGRVNSCRAGGCNNPNLKSKNNINSEYFDYFILFNSKKQVVSVRVFNYQASHGYEISSKGWLKQFKGYQADKQLKVNKNIDQISGATISVNAIVDDIAFVTNILQKL